MIRYEDSSYAIQGARASFDPVTLNDGRQYGFQGSVETPYGIVRVYATLQTRWDSERRQFEILTEQRVTFATCQDGRIYYHTEHRPSARLTERGAATVAHRWIRELCE